MQTRQFNRIILLASVASLLCAAPALAQESVAPDESAVIDGNTGDIVVTARKRAETVMATPVVLQVIGTEQIRDLMIDNPADLTSVVPGLQINYSSAVAGATVNMRGLGNGPSVNYAELSTALNLDGATAPHGAFFRAGLFDLAQVEVLKGPQALFFGKSTSTGVIVINTANPTDDWQTEVSAGYEFNADNVDLSGYVSGPLSEHFGIRLAAIYSDSKGWMYSTNPNTSAPRLPAEENKAVRLTLEYDNPDVGLLVRFKGALSSNKQNVGLGFRNQGVCQTTFNAPVLRDYDNCKLDKFANGLPDPVPYRPDLDYSPFNVDNFSIGGPSPSLRDGPYSFTKTKSAILNADYEILDGLTLTSLSSYLKVTNGESQTFSIPSNQVLSFLGYDNKVDELSQELRLTSDWKDSWINFMVGGLYADGNRDNGFLFQLSRLTIPGVGAIGLYTDNSQKFYSKTKSGFAQVLITPIESLELAAGVRHTNVVKGFSSLFQRNNYPAFFNPGPAGEVLQNVPLNLRRVREKNTSPEFTLTYRPNDNLTAFLSYKEGYKAHGFNIAGTATTQNATTMSPFKGETVKGFEGGVKAQLLDRQLSLTAAAYRYNYNDMQVSFLLPGTATVIIANGADIRVQGFELGADYRPDGIAGLSLGAFVNYNDAHYRSFPAAPCYGSQTAAQGCVDLGGGARAQDLGGRRLHQAPKWQGYLSADYKWDLNDKFAASIGGRATWSGSYKFTPEFNPLGIQKSFVTLDGSLKFGRNDRTWEVALQCRNCTNKIYVVNGLDGGAVNPGEVSAIIATIAQTRQVMLQLTLRPEL